MVYSEMTPVLVQKLQISILVPSKTTRGGHLLAETGSLGRGLGGGKGG